LSAFRPHIVSAQKALYGLNSFLMSLSDLQIVVKIAVRRFCCLFV